jgi:hypothetical protein
MFPGNLFEETYPAVQRRSALPADHDPVLFLPQEDPAFPMPAAQVSAPRTTSQRPMTGRRSNRLILPVMALLCDLKSMTAASPSLVKNPGPENADGRHNKIS